MKWGVMLADVLQSLLRKPATERYPRERRPPPGLLRGALRFDPRQCTGCNLCVKDCPAEALEVITLDKTAKRYGVRYHVDRCTFCAQCVQSCPHGCLSLRDGTWELAARSREPFTLQLGDDADGQIGVAGGAGAKPAEKPAG